VEPSPRSIVVVIDVSGLAEPDALTLEALVRLQLIAHRMGASIRLHNPCAELVDLLALVGLSEVLPVIVESPVESDRLLEPDRLVEEREQVLVDEEVDPGDAAI
jgi:anti-anti-sigma regulatory factor